MELYGTYYGDEIKVEFTMLSKDGIDADPEMGRILILGVSVDETLLPHDLRKKLYDLHHYVEEWKRW